MVQPQCSPWGMINVQWLVDVHNKHPRKGQETNSASAIAMLSVSSLIVQVHMISHRYAVEKETTRDKVLETMNRKMCISSILTKSLAYHKNLETFSVGHVSFRCIAGVGAWKLLHINRMCLPEWDGWLQRTE
jgi:mannitol-specific phosphotransferase system IIBC component